jgi:hypothetical protein
MCRLYRKFQNLQFTNLKSDLKTAIYGPDVGNRYDCDEMIILAIVGLGDIHSKISLFVKCFGFRSILQGHVLIAHGSPYSVSRTHRIEVAHVPPHDTFIRK